MNNRELKYRISRRIVEHIAEMYGMTTEEYGRVYNGEEHERLLNDLMLIIAEATR